jgi:signal transduction histidine kinase
VTVRLRLVVTIAGIALLVALPALYGVTRLAAVRDLALHQRGRHGAALSALGRLQTRLTEVDRFQRSYISAPSPELHTAMYEALARARFHLSRLAEVGYSDPAAHAAVQLDSIEAATRQLELLVEERQMDEATVLFEDVKPIFARTQETLDSIGRAIDVRSRGDAVQANLIAAAAATTTLISLLIALTLALGLGAWVTTALTRPLRRLQTGIADVAEGRLVSPPDLPYSRQDEIGDLARSFRAMAGRLAELDRIRIEFVGMTSHELKTPINVIGGYAELLDEGMYGPVSDRQREALAAILDQSRKLGEMVNQLQNITRLEAGAFLIEPQATRVDTILAPVRRTFAALAKQKQIQFDVERGTDAPDPVVVDAERIRNEVLGNLLSNAFKFTPPGGRIRLYAGREDERLCLEVSDTGVGIPPDDLPYIFDKYYQAGGAEKSKGSGLGLAIARQVVQDHGGEIDVSSEPGAGATFRILLPANGAPPR